jgi:hypothetical protein
MLLLLNAWLALGGETQCRGLLTAKPTDVLAIAGANPFSGWIPPGVKCSSKFADRGSTPCDARSQITEDRDIGGGRRLVVARSYRPDAPEPSDYVFIFGCAGGHPQAVFHDPVGYGTTVDYASAERVTLSGRCAYQVSDKKGLPVCKAGAVSFYWNEQTQDYTSAPGNSAPPPESEPSCGLLSANANDVLELAKRQPFSQFMPSHTGCSSEDEIDYPDNCDWKSEIAEDRMISRDLRLLVIGEGHMTGTGAWGAVVVLGCIDGHLKAVFHDRFEFGADIEDAAADKLVLIATGQERMIYRWNKELKNYVLSEVEFRPRNR